jgi:hypothetical protein
MKVGGLFVDVGLAWVCFIRGLGNERKYELLMACLKNINGE